MINWYEVLGKNLYTIDKDLGLIIESNPKRMTKLEQLEKVVRC